MFSTSPKFKYLFCSLSVVATAFTFSGLTSVLSCFASMFQTFSAFNKDDRRLRELMIIGTSFWLVHNYLVGSPKAVVMEALFIGSNLLGYYRFYFRKNVVA